MPSITHIGSFSALAFGWGGAFSPPAAVNVLTTNYSPTPSGTVTVTFPGCQPGQLAVLVWTRSNPSALAGWTFLAAFTYGGRQSDVCYKLLTAGDIASGATFNYSAGNGVLVALVYDIGPIKVTQVTQLSGTTGTVVVPGFTKSASSRGMISYFGDTGFSISLIRPAGWTQRAAAFRNATNPDMSMAVAELSPPTGYTNGSTITWGGAGGGGNAAGAAVLELT